MIDINYSCFVWVNGIFYNISDAHIIHIGTRSLHYANSLFEGLVCYDGIVLKPVFHINRILNSSFVLNLPIYFSCFDILIAILELIIRNDFIYYNTYIRPILFSGCEFLSIIINSLYFSNFCILIKEHFSFIKKICKYFYWYLV